MNFPPMPRQFEDFDAAFDAAGVDTSPEEQAQGPNPAADSARSSASMEELMMEQFLDELIEAKQNSLAYQGQQADQNKAQRQEADMLERKLGR